MASVIDTRSAVFGADVQLAGLCCTRLVGLLQGTVSVGLPTLATGIPDPNSFFPDQFERMDAYSVVLGTVSGKPIATELLTLLRECSGDVRQALHGLQLELNKLLEVQPRERITGLDSVRDLALAVCDDIGKYAGLLNIDVPGLANLKTLIVQMIEAIPALLPDRCVA
jgi:hypothetical protein